MRKLLLSFFAFLIYMSAMSQDLPPRFRALVLYENGGHHIAYSQAGRAWLDRLAADSNFSLTYINNTDSIDAGFLDHFRLFIQLDYPPYGWKEKAVMAFTQYIGQGKGGWIGFHHATLLGEFDGFGIWPWFSDFMGGIRFTNYIPGFADGVVKVEDRTHPCMKGIDSLFPVEKEEWYTWNKSPRPNVHVIASVEESSYRPGSDIKMGDHPVVWSNTSMPARNIYIFMGHSPALFQNAAYTTLFRNAIFWAAQTGGPVIYANQVGYDAGAPKIAVLEAAEPLEKGSRFSLVNAEDGKPVFKVLSGKEKQLPEWRTGKYYYRLDFSGFSRKGRYRLEMDAPGMRISSEPFIIQEHALASLTLPSIVGYYQKQRADKPEEVAADTHVILYGSDKTADVRGGWCDASGDISKYFSHLSYTNTMMPQQIPLVTWSLLNTAEQAPGLLQNLRLQDAMDKESAWGADYIMRSLSPEGYFYMTVFSYFNPDPNKRRIVGLLANSVTTSNYQCAFREGGGMAIAALARIAGRKLDGAFTHAQYLAAAKKAFAHLQVNNTKYDDDGKENIIDDYCALLAATELWMATGENAYRDEARKRAAQLSGRVSKEGYFIADHTGHPFWHASDAGLPIIALARYLDREKENSFREIALSAIRKSLSYELRVTNNTANPFGYARQTFAWGNGTKNGFFIPHENASGWWWQGENARLASLAAAAWVGAGTAYRLPEDRGVIDSLHAFAMQQLSWVLGCNPYAMCFMYGFGKNNVPYMHSLFGHGSEKGGISNGITGAAGHPDGSGISYKEKDNGNEWRWTEQWLPHAAWFLQAITAMAKP